MSHKPTLILLHGALGAQSQFDNLRSLLKESFKTHTLDFEGHGSAFLKEGDSFSIELFVQNLKNFLDENSIERADIFGYSMGGYVALHLAAIEPERINRILTLGTKFNWTPESATQETKMLDRAKMLEKVPAFVDVLKERHFASGWETVVDKTKEMMLSLGENPVLKEDVLKNIHQRVRIGVGDRDNMVTFEESRDVFMMLPNAEFEVLPNTPHPFEKVSGWRLASSIMNFFV
ncbi:MAG TPA: alpha/beta fold hydrolase [Patescibacteria group bacterium]|nr:alpha/beta fold hydrolase [Patescibacteria group bacterium]